MPSLGVLFGPRQLLMVKTALDVWLTSASLPTLGSDFTIVASVMLSGDPNSILCKVPHCSFQEGAGRMQHIWQQHGEKGMTRIALCLGQLLRGLSIANELFC